MLLTAFFTVHLSKNHACGEHAHAFAEVVFVDGSEGTVWFEEREEKVPDHSILIHPARTRHRAWNKNSCRHHCLGFSGGEFGKLLPAVYPATPEIIHLFRTMSAELTARKKYYRQILETMGKEVLLRILRIQDSPDPLLKENGDGPQSLFQVSQKSPPKMEVVRHHLENAVSGGMDLDTLSDELLISKDYLRHAFKKEYGISPMQYLIQRRLEEAKHLLDSTDLMAREIAGRCGFENEYYFSRLFRQVVGMPPTRWRKRKLHLSEEKR